MSIQLERPTTRNDVRASGDRGYSPYALSADARRFGLTTSSMRLTGGTVVVRHGRRSTSATATILVHGAAGSWSTWTPLLQAAEATAHDLNDLIIPDLPGWGDSAPCADESALSVESMAALIADLARSLGYERWNVVGHSMGGFIALQLAASETRATTSVGLVSATSLSIRDSIRHPIRRVRALPAFTLLLLIMRLLWLAGPLGHCLVRFVAGTSLLRALVAPLFSRPRAVDASVVDALGAEVRPAAFVLAAARAGAYDAATHWAQISCPVRSLQGDNDVFVTAGDAARLRAAVPHCSISTIAGAGHFGQLERPLDVLLRLEIGVPRPIVSTMIELAQGE